MSENPFIIYKASAGAGKTHTLVREYLKMAFSLGEGRLAEGMRSILAITFTNKVYVGVAQVRHYSSADIRQAPSP